MSLLLKNVWRTVMRSSRVSQSTYSSRTLSSNATELSTTRAPDPAMSSIKTASSAGAVLAAVQRELPRLDHTHLLQALRTLFELQRADKSSASEELIKDPGFGLLCQNFKKHARALEVNDIIEATKVLIFLRVPPDSLILQTMLQLIRCNINQLNVRHVMFLDFLLTRFETSNHLVDALKLALPLVFQIHLPLEMDHDDLPMLRDMLAYACNNGLPDRCVNNIVTGLLLHDQAINAATARSVVWSLCEVNCTEDVFPTRVELLHRCLNTLSQKMSQLNYEDVLRLTAKLKGRIVEKHKEYYHEGYMDAAADYVVTNEVEFEKALLIARVLSRVAHTHLGLAQYLCERAGATPLTLANARANVLLGFVNCLSNNNFTPQQELWAELRRQMSHNPAMEGQGSLPWTKFCLELASLGHYEDRILKKVFSQDFLDQQLSKEDNQLDYLQLLTLQEAVNAFHSEEYKLPATVLERARAIYPLHSLTEQLEAHLARALGAACVARNVALESGIVADLLVCLKNGYPLELPQLGGEHRLPISELQLPEDGVIVCVMNFSPGCFSMNSNRLRGTFRLLLDILEKQGYATVPVNAHRWAAAPDHEKTPFLLREVGYKCGEIGMKLCVT